MKMMRWLRRKKLNNKGMTLVEIIVAVAVFTVVAIPIMRIFGSSSSTNFQARRVQRATLVGEAVMESFKAYDMEAIVTQVVDNSYNGLKLTGIAPEVKAYVGGAETSDVLLSDRKLRRDADYFKFNFDGVEADGMILNVEVMATPRERGQLLRMESPNAYSDAIYTIDAAFNNEQAATVAEKAKEALIATKPTVAMSDISDVTTKDFKRVTTLNISDSDGVQKVTIKMNCTANATLKYKATDATGKKVDKDETIPLNFDMEFEQEDTTMTDELVIYDNTNTIAGESKYTDVAKLDNIYLYYCPAYDWFFGENASEEFVLEGNLTAQYDSGGTALSAEALGRNPLKVVLTKQKYIGIDDVKLNLQEMGYSAKATSNLTGSGETILMHNFDENMAGEGGSVLTPVPVAGFDAEKTYSLNSAKPEDCGFTDTVELFYDLVVDVYRVENDGTAPKVATFTGTTVK